jgi:hypothetical protein
MGSSSSVFQDTPSFSSSLLDPEIRNAKYGPPPPLFSEEFDVWKARYLFQDGPIMRKVRKETNQLRVKILMDIPLEFLQPTIVIIYCPHLSLTTRLTNYIQHKLKYDLILKENYSSTTEMFHQILSRNDEFFLEQCQRHQQSDHQSPSHENIRKDVIITSGPRKGCLLYNYPTNSSEVLEFNECTRDYRKVVIIFDYEIMKLSRSLSEQWIHLPSQRLYDDDLCPPKNVLLARNKSDKMIDSSSYLDDITSEPLTKVQSPPPPPFPSLPH